MAILKEPDVTMKVIDYSQLSPTSSDVINIGIPINADTGRSGIIKINNLNELIEEYLTGDAITADSDITIKIASKLLRSTPLYISRATASQVLCGLSDKGKTFYTDTAFEPLNVLTQLKLQQPNFYVKPLYFIEQIGAIYYCVYANGTLAEVHEDLALQGVTISFARSVKITDGLSTTGYDVDEEDDRLVSLSDFIHLIMEHGSTLMDGVESFFTFTQIEENDNYITFTTPTGVNFKYYSSKIASGEISSVSLGCVQSEIPCLVDNENSDYVYNYTENDEICFNDVSYFFKGMGSVVKNYLGTQNPIQKYHGNTTLTSATNKMKANYFIPYMINSIIGNNGLVPQQLGETTSFGFDFVLPATGYQFETCGFSEYSLINSSLEVGTNTTINKVLCYSIQPIKGGAIRIVNTTTNKFIVMCFGNYSNCLETFQPTNADCSASFVCSDIKTEFMAFIRFFEWLNLSSENYSSVASPISGTFMSANCNLDKLKLFTDGILTANGSLTHNFVTSIGQYNIDESLTMTKTNDVVTYDIAQTITPTTTNKTFDIVWEENSLNTLTSVIAVGEAIINNNVPTFQQAVLTKDSLNKEAFKLEDTWLQVIVNGTTTYTFYNGDYNSNDDTEETISIGSSPYSYDVWLAEFRSAVSNYFKTTNTSDGVTFFDYDASNTYEFRGKKNVWTSVDNPDPASDDYDVMSKITSNRSSILTTDCFGVVSKAINKTNICKFQLTQSEENDLIYNLRLQRKTGDDSYVDYEISFAPDVTNGYGTNIYYNYVNELSTYFHVIKFSEFNEDNTVEPSTQQLGWWGSAVPMSPPSSSDYIKAMNEFRQFDGVYYSFLFDAGYVNISFANNLVSIANEIYSQALISLPDKKDIAQIISYRNDLGISSWEATFSHPYAVDQTIGDFITYVTPQVAYLERILYNAGSGKEYAPVFGLNNAVMDMTPKYAYNKKDDREQLYGSQINVITYDKNKGYAYRRLDLTAQKIDSSLSSGNNIRMINRIAHICDEQMEYFIGEFNTEQTRNTAKERVENQIKRVLQTNQQYSYNEVKVICDSSNNPDSVIEARELVIDILIKFEQEIRYVKCFTKVYKLSTNLDEV